MPRTQFVGTVAVAAVVDSDLDAAGNVQVDIYERGTTSHAQVYTTEGGGTAFPNPYETTYTGEVRFWADFGKYDVKFTDLSGSPRFSAYTIGWDSTPYDSLAGTVPPGIIAPTGLRSAPEGWLMCDGSEVSRSSYSDLWDALRTDATGALTGSSPYGNGNGSTTFNLPDGRGRVLAGVDGSAGRISANDAIGQSGGADMHTLATSEIPSHVHANALNDPGHWHYFTAFHQNNPSSGASVGNQWSVTLTLATAYNYLISGSTFPGIEQLNTSNVSLTNVAAGGGGAHNNMPPYLVTNYIIKT